MTSQEAAFELFERPLEEEKIRSGHCGGGSGRGPGGGGLSAEDTIPRVFLDRGSDDGRFLDPFNRRGEASVILKGSDEIGSIEIRGLDKTEEQWLKDRVPVLADEAALDQGVAVEEEGDGEDDLGDGQCNRQRLRGGLLL